MIWWPKVRGYGEREVEDVVQTAILRCYTRWLEDGTEPTLAYLTKVIKLIARENFLKEPRFLDHSLDALEHAHGVDAGVIDRLVSTREPVLKVVVDIPALSLASASRLLLAISELHVALGGSRLRIEDSGGGEFARERVLA